MKKFLKIYGIITMLLVHIGIWICMGYDKAIFNWEMPIIDIIIISIILAITYIFSNICFLLPFMFIMSIGTTVSTIAATSILWFPICKLACYLGSDMFILFDTISWLWMLIIPFISAIGVLNITSWYYIYKTEVESTDY